jgi:multiphosphoryl transfer protein
MIGIVIVSHSRQLAEGVRDLAEQMTQGKVPLAIAAGIDDPENPLGTDAMQIYQAIESVYSESGVLILMDLGSALMSAELALEFCSPDQQAHIHLCAAPLVEGTIAAAVAATASSDIAQIMTEARQSLAAKMAQLGESDSVSTAPLETRSPLTSQDTQTARYTIRNRFGLHARPAAQFVTTAAQFQAQIQVKNLTRATNFVSANSITQLAMLNVQQGDEIEISAHGEDATAALTAFRTLIDANFGEADPPDSPDHQPEVTLTASSTTANLTGIPASPGVAIAPLLHYQPQPIQIESYTIADPQAEGQRLQTAITAAQQHIEMVRSQTAQRSEAEAAIFDAHRLFLQDPALVEAAHQRILAERINAELAWQSVVDAIAATYRDQENVYLKARSTDILDVGQQVLRQLTGKQPPPLQLAEPAILVAMDLTPSDTAQLQPEQILGICTALGSATSHSAILARTLGIPAVVGLGTAIAQIESGTTIAIDGETGQIWLNPTAESLIQLQAKQQQWQAIQQQAQAVAHQPALTRDGQELTVMANIASQADAQKAIAAGAQGVGLLRTEFLYFNRTAAPTELEQAEVYGAIAATLGDRPLIIRTLDIGGDKPLPYLSNQPEANPFLGDRGIRFCLSHPDLFKAQLRAILRISSGHAIKLMFPMIATLTELQAAKALLAEAQTELEADNIAFDPVPVGIMVEVPAAVAIADQLAAEVDFFSIGTNDLSQYLMAADRTNPRVASLTDALHPAVLRMIQRTVQMAHEAGIWVGLCGELAADRLAVPILLGLGLDEVSASPTAIPLIKQTVGQFSLSEAKAIAETALQQTSVAEVRSTVQSFFKK